MLTRRLIPIVSALLFAGPVFAQVPAGTGAQVTGTLTNGNCVEATGAKSIGDSGSPCSGSAAMLTSGANATSAALGNVAGASSVPLGLAKGGTNADLSATGGTSQFLR